MSHGDDFRYAGEELALFLDARNWKSYVATVLRPFLGERVLEVGAGVGAMTRVLKPYCAGRWLALEPDPVLLESLRRNVESWGLREGFESAKGTIETLTGGATFDTILYLDVLEHISDDRGEVEKAARHLAPGGSLVVLAPAHQCLYTEFDRTIGHFRRYSRDDLKRLTPHELSFAHGRYYDIAGMLASLANRLFLHSASPTQKQIHFWDRTLVPLSRFLDPLSGFTVGRSVVAVWRRNQLEQTGSSPDH